MKTEYRCKYHSYYCMGT